MFWYLWIREHKKEAQLELVVRIFIDIHPFIYSVLTLYADVVMSLNIDVTN